MSVSHAPNREAVAKRRAEAKAERAKQRAIRRLQRRCFWSWPWGHTWDKPRFCYAINNRRQMHRCCVGCGKDGSYVEVD